MGFSIETSVSAVTVFLQGALSFFSPCVLPLVPLYVSYLAGGAAVVGEDGVRRYPRGKIFLNTLFFVVGISFAFFLLGLGLTALGEFFHNYQVWFARASGVIILLFGLYQPEEGVIKKDGQVVQIKDPNDSINAGIAFITEDRQKLGLMLHASVLENATIIGLREKIKGFFVNIKKFPPLIEPLLKELRVKTPSVWTEAVYLSGGNQQKVVLAKWLYAEQDIYIFDEPTRGIDVNAKAEFYKQMSNLTKQGKCILMISSDMPELISMSDRVLVVRDGRIDCELKGEQINEQEIIKRALGVNKDG